MYRSTYAEDSRTIFSNFCLFGDIVSHKYSCDFKWDYASRNYGIFLIISITVPPCQIKPLLGILVVLLLGSGVKKHVGKKACLFKSRGVKRHVVKSQSVNWHAVFRQSMKKGMSRLWLIRIQPQCMLNISLSKYSAHCKHLLSSNIQGRIWLSFLQAVTANPTLCIPNCYFILAGHCLLKGKLKKVLKTSSGTFTGRSSMLQRSQKTIAGNFV